MTAVAYKMDGGKCSIAANGHAEGSSEVCAGISAIMYALGGWLVNAAQDGKAKVHCIKLDSGCAELSATGGEDVESVFSMAIIGLMQIAQAYPQHVKILEK